jgi:hypothetical protein
VRTLVLVAVSSALIGGVTGASVALFAASGSPKKATKSASAPGTHPGESPGGAPLEERLANLEQALRVLERRSSPLRSFQSADAGSAASAAPGQRPEEEASVVDDPVFEAAVRDVIERAEIDRDNEREVRREDRRKQMATRWADDIAPRLSLNEQQKAKLLEVAQQFMSELGRLWGERDGGAPQSRTERRAEMQRLREQSEQKLRTILDPNQMRTYDSLGEEDKLGFPRRRGGDRGERGER